MNTKYLAAVLAVAAIIGVAVLVYVVLLREPAPSIQSQSDSPQQTSQPVNPPTESSPGKTGSESGGPLIDYDSELLLKPIDPAWIAPYPHKELPREFGKPIFIRGKPGKSLPPGNQKPKHNKRSSRDRRNPRENLRS